jgi:hypothetical protein
LASSASSRSPDVVRRIGVVVTGGLLLENISR